MNKKYIIKENTVFQEMIHHAASNKSPFFVIFYSKNSYSYGRFGISVGKKVGNAVVRNRLKRQVRAILRDFQKDYFFCYDCIIMVRGSCLSISYQQMRESLFILLEKISRGGRK